MSDQKQDFFEVGGIAVPKDAIQDLIKSEIAKLKKDELGAHMAKFFSDYSMIVSMSGTLGRDKPRNTVNFPLLRATAQRSFIDKLLIRARKDQFKRIWQPAVDGKTKTVGFKVVHDRHDDPNFKGSKDIDKRCREMQEFLMNPTPANFIDIYPQRILPHHGLKDLVARLVEAELVIDRKVLRRYPRADGKGYAAFHWLSGDTIKPVSEAIKNWLRKKEAKDKKASGMSFYYQTVEMSYATGLDIVNAAYVQEVDGLPCAAFTEDEITLHISNPSDELNKHGYGESRLEMGLELTTVFLYQWAYNRELFNTNYPDRILKISGDFDKAGLEAFKNQLRGESGVGKNHRLPVISTGEPSKESVESLKVESIQLRDTPKDMLFSELFRFLLLLKCSSYSIHPTVLNFNSDNGGASSTLGNGGAAKELEIEESKDQGLESMLTDWCEWFTRDLIKPRYDDLKLIIVGLNEEDEKQVVDLRKTRTGTWLTRNEARQEEGLEPIGEIDDPNNPWNYPADAPVANYMNTISMIQQQSAGGDEGGGEGDYGDEAGQGGDQGDQGQEGADVNYDENFDKSQKEKTFRIVFDK